MADMPPTCLFINNSPQPGRKDLAKLGGGGKSLLGLLSHLPETGWKTHVVVPGEGQFTDELAKLSIPHTIYPFKQIGWRQPFESLSTTLWWNKLFRHIRPSLIHANGFELSRSFSVAAAMSGIPYITHVRFPVEPDGARWTLRNLPKPAAFIFNSHAMMDSLWPNLSMLAPRSKAYVAHNAVDLENFAPAPWPDSPTLRIGIVANFAPFKRHEDFLRMAAEMISKRQDLEFWIVGEDTQGTGRRAALEQLARELEVDSYVRFLGHRSDIPDIMRQLHLLVVPSQFEPFGRVVIEAMACGRPVIGSRDGGIPEIIEEGKTGYLIELGDWKGFARAALDLLADREKWTSMSQHASAAARNRFSIASHVTQIIGIYREILG
jgi:glycosyltransferase involved in cell wall biosynthesis